MKLIVRRPDALHRAQRDAPRRRRRPPGPVDGRRLGQGLDTPARRMTSAVPHPSAVVRMIRARHQNDTALNAIDLPPKLHASPQTEHRLEPGQFHSTMQHGN